jgi:hypothetical protein
VDWIQKEKESRLTASQLHRTSKSSNVDGKGNEEYKTGNGML